ncbi:MAG TPA: 16S rRNA (cytosine(1402)-N(4))-methyltransferase RsmH [bacterium]|nr:16S rRNA (cytosine(1402)-N(4))-methyltransferase RsmH [bacterium]HNS34438.1 16S rRNA (cytosine(1402)-N(4))-methyltransferase RsmH [bacterium]HNW09223.1 16S rRNA (cytosine(1402)-N(4))-methyltransferase RsmH [bacterium]HPN81558.1 16S rRNA (cytosine(1402)-N(4))-methyltransferase RsmH [bacterium]HPW39192.1 16S rRNA (cytosine(1402)-N(4))-methyltransferase RsmH [bacterium]
MTTIHQPVLLREVLSLLNPQPNQVFVDGTFGGGGHSLAILERVKPTGRVVGIDWDPTVVQNSVGDNLILVNDNYKNLKKILAEAGIDKVDGILLDLGLSSDQLGAGNRGFSFQGGDLDLRFNPVSNRPTAAQLLADCGEEQLNNIFFQYGEERLARPIAREIINLRQSGHPIKTAPVLAETVAKVYARYFKGRSFKNPATKVFQALRIAVNDEFANLEQALPEAIDALKPGGRLAVIAFHSGEDRIVKHFFRKMEKLARPVIKIITKKPVSATASEIKNNPRSRSAKLRVAEKIIN